MHVHAPKDVALTPYEHGIVAMTLLLVACSYNLHHAIIMMLMHSSHHKVRCLPGVIMQHGQYDLPALILSINGSAAINREQHQRLDPLVYSLWRAVAAAAALSR